MNQSTNLLVQAHDFGTPRLNSSTTYRICVKAFNQYQPVFQFPGQVTEVSVREVRVCLNNQ